MPTTREIKEVIPHKASNLSLTHSKNSMYICFFPSNCLEDSIASLLFVCLLFEDFKHFGPLINTGDQGKVKNCETSYKVVGNLQVSHFLPGVQ